MSDLIEAFDANYAGESTLKHAIVDILESKRAESPAIRMVEEDVLFQVAERSLAQYEDYDDDVRFFNALREVTNFLTLATEGITASGSIKHTDLLPENHPESTKTSELDFFTLRTMRAEWLAADARIESEEARAIIAAVYSSNPLSVEYQYHLARLSALEEGQVPSDLLLEPILAFGNPYAGKNSFWHRSMRANKQRRDDEGQFAEMGGGARFFAQLPNGRFISVVGKIAGLPENDPTGIDIEVLGVPGLWDGIYTVPAAYTHTFKAILPPNEDDSANPDYVSLPQGKPYVKVADLIRKDLPTSWFESKFQSIIKDLKDVTPDKTYATGDGYRLNYYNNADKDVVSRALGAQKRFGSQIINRRGTDQLIAGDPVLELISTKRGQEEVVGYAQDWASAQKLATLEDETYPDQENEPLRAEERDRQPAAARMESAPEEGQADETPDVIAPVNPDENKPAQWTKINDNEYLDPYSGFMVKFGMATVASEADGTPIRMDNVFDIIDFISNENLGVAFNWDGVTELVEAFRNNRPDTSKEPGVNRMASEVELSGLDEKRNALFSVKDTEGETQVSEAQLKYLTNLYNYKDLPGYMVDAFDEITASPADFSVKQGAKLIAIFKNRPDMDGFRGVVFRSGKVVEDTLLRQQLRDALANPEAPDSIEIAGFDGNTKAALEEAYKGLPGYVLKSALKALGGEDFDLVPPPVDNAPELDIKKLLEPQRMEREFVKKFGEEPDGRLTERRMAGLSRVYNAIKEEIKPALKAAFWDLQKNPEKYTNAEAQRLFYLLNNQDRVPNIAVPSVQTTAKSKAPVATIKQLQFIKKLLDNGSSLPAERVSEIRNAYDKYNVREAAAAIDELKKAEIKSGSSNDAINPNNPSPTPQYLTTNITDEGRAPSQAMLAMIEFLLENKNIPADEVQRLIETIPDEPRKVIKDIIDDLSLRENKSKYAPVGALRTHISDPKAAPSPRMLRALERMRFRGLIPDDVWDDVLKRVPTMFRGDVSREFLAKFKEMEDEMDANLIKASMQKGYDINGLRNGAEGKRLVDVPENYKPQFPGKYLGPTEEQINKAMEAQVAESTGVRVGWFDVTGDGILDIPADQGAKDALGADMTKFRRNLRNVLADFAEILETPDRVVSVGAKEVLKRAWMDLNILNARMRFGRRLKPLTAKELDSQLAQIAEGIISMRPDGAGIYGTPRSRRQSDKTNLTRAKAGVLDLVGLFKGGVFASPEEQEAATFGINRMVSLPVAVEKPRTPYVDPPTFIGPAFDALKEATNWEAEVIPFLKNQDMYIIDFETTGLRDLDDPDIKNDPIQIAVSKVRGLQVVDFFTTYINPESKLSAYTLKGVGDGNGGKVTEEFLQQFPTKKEVMQQVMDFIPQGSIIGGHNFYVFDKEVLDRTMQEAGLEGLNPSGYIDTLGLARYMMPKWTPENPDAPYKVVNGVQRPAHTLEALVSYFGLSNNGRHEADADVYSTIDVLNRMLDRAKRGLGHKGADFSFNDSENKWDQNAYDVAIEEYQDKAVKYWLSRYRTLLALRGLSPEEVEAQLIEDFKSVSEGVSLGDNRDAVITPVIESIKGLPGGSYAVDTRDGRVGQVIGQAASGNLLVRFLAAGGDTEQKVGFEEIPAFLLANVTEDFISKNGILADYGMEVVSEVGKSLRISQLNQGSVVARLGNLQDVISIGDLIIAPLSSETEAASRDHKKKIIDLVDQLEARKALSRPLANAYRAAVDNAVYSIDGANRVIARLGNAIDQFDLIEANSDIADKLPEGGFPAASPEINRMAARAAKTKRKTDASDLSDDILKGLDDALTIKLTDEGSDILKSLLHGENVGASALAGVGKTTLTEQIARAYKKKTPLKKLLYIVFGKENQLEADARMPENVESRTMDSLAYNASVNRDLIEKYRIQPSLADAKNSPINLKVIGAVTDNFGISRATAPKNAPHVTAERIAVEAFYNWLKSSDKFPTKQHIDSVQEMGSYAPSEDKDYEFYIDLINRMWKDVVSPVDLEENQILIDGNMLMKNWALSDPDFREVNSDGKSLQGFAAIPDLIMLDEAQDINPVFLGMLMAQDEIHKNHIQRFVVGDPLQQIFGFRGTANAFDSLPMDRLLPLTKSFRFGQETADVANKILEYVKAPQRLVGNPDVSTSIDEKSPETIDADLVITRTNFGIIEAGLFYSILDDNLVMAATQNFKQRYTESLKYLRWLSAGGINTGRKYDKRTPKEFVGMQTWDMFIQAASARQNADLVAMKNMIFRIKKMQRFEKNWEAIEYLQNLVNNMRIVRETFSVPDEINKSGKLGGRIKYAIDKGRIVLSDLNDKNKRYGTGVWDNTIVLDLNGFTRGEGDDKFSFSAPAKADVRKQLQTLVSMLNGEDADMILTTGHGAKGLEADNVVIWEDWADPRKSAKERDRAFAKEELQLAYVALTRAKQAMLTGGLEWVVNGDLEQMANHRFADETPTAEGEAPAVNRMASEDSVDAGYEARAASEVSYLETSLKLEKENLQRPQDSRMHREPDYAIKETIKNLEEKIQGIKDNPLYQKKIDQELVDMAPDLENALRENSATEDQRFELMMRAGITLWSDSSEPIKLFKNIDKLNQRVEEAQMRLSGDAPSINKMVSSGGDDIDLDDPEDSVPASGEPVSEDVLSGYREENQSFAEQMGQQMIEAIQKTGKLPWQKPWTAEGTLPTSGATGKVYRRYNLLWLNMVSEWFGYKGTRWYTENNVKKMGGYLSEDAIGHAIAYVKTVKYKSKEKTLVDNPDKPGETITKTEEVEKSYAKVGWFKVYNEDDIRGIELPPIAKREPVAATEAEQIMIDSYVNHPPILHRRQDNAYWSPLLDEIHLPERDQFTSAEEYFATLAHEFTHSTAHPDRLNNRKEPLENYGKHKESRAREELIAEIGAAMLAQIFNIEVTYDNSTAYVADWLTALKDDPAMVMEAATIAGQSVEHILGGYWLSIEKGLVEADAETDYVPTKAIGAETGEITGVDGEFNGLGDGVNYRIEGDQIILLGNTKEYKDEIKSVSVDNNGRPFKFFWHGKSGTWRISLGGENAESNRIEALKELRDKIAEKSGTPGVNKMAAELPGESDGTFVERIYKLNQDIADFYHENFLSASAYSPVVKYFTGRGFNREIASKFQIGRSTGRNKGAGWKSLIVHLTKLGYSEEEMLASGVVNKNQDNGLIYDLFAAGPTGDDRIIFPIKDVDGRVTSFVARSINADEEAKYMYSRTTVTTRKSNSLFGIDVAKNGIQKRNQIIFVEGQMDLLAMHAAGIDNAVAISGSAFGQGHLNIFESLANREDKIPMVVFFFDADDAGQKAQDSGLRLVMNADQPYDPEFVSLRDTQYQGMDPADIYKDGGASALLSVLKNKKFSGSWAYTDAYLERNYDRLIYLIASEPSPSAREELIRLFAESIGMSYNELKQLVDAAIQNKQ